MSEFLQPLLILALAVLSAGMWGKLRHLEFRIEQLGDWLARDIHRIEYLERQTRNGIHEEEWLPRSVGMNHHAPTQ